MSLFKRTKNTIKLSPFVWEARFEVKRANVVDGAVFSGHVKAYSREEMWDKYVAVAQEVNSVLTVMADDNGVLPETYFYSYDYTDFEQVSHTGAGNTKLVENFLDSIIMGMENDNANVEDELYRQGFYAGK